MHLYRGRRHDWNEDLSEFCCVRIVTRIVLVPGSETVSEPGTRTTMIKNMQGHLETTNQFVKIPNFLIRRVQSQWSRAVATRSNSYSFY